VTGRESSLWNAVMSSRAAATRVSSPPPASALAERPDQLDDRRQAPGRRFPLVAHVVAVREAGEVASHAPTWIASRKASAGAGRRHRGVAASRDARAKRSARWARGKNPSTRARGCPRVLVRVREQHAGRRVSPAVSVRCASVRSSTSARAVSTAAAGVLRGIGRQQEGRHGERCTEPTPSPRCARRVVVAFLVTITTSRAEIAICCCSSGPVRSTSRRRGPITRGTRIDRGGRDGPPSGDDADASSTHPRFTPSCARSGDSAACVSSADRDHRDDHANTGRSHPAPRDPPGEVRRRRCAPPAAAPGGLPRGAPASREPLPSADWARPFRRSH